MKSHLVVFVVSMITFFGVGIGWMPAQETVSQGSISPGQSREVQLFPNQEHQFDLVVNQGGTVTIEMERSNGSIDPYLQLFNANGREIDSDDDGGRDLNSRISGNLEPGRYRIIAREFGRDDRGAYRISVHAAGTGSPVSGIPLTIGQSIDSYINDGEPQVFTFSLREAQRVRIDLRRTGSGNSIDPYLELGDEFGSVLASNDDGGSGLDSRITQYLDPGRYTITAYDLGDDDTGGIQVELAGLGSGAIQGIPITIGESISAYLMEGTPQEFTLEVPSAQRLQIDMIRGEDSDIDPYLVLADQFGNEIETNDDGGSGFNSRIARYLEAGRYTITARDLFGGDAGAFRLEVVSQGSDPLGGGIPIAVGQSIDSFITNGQEQPFILTVEEETTVVIDLERGSDSTIDPYMTLSDSVGREIAADDDGGSGFNSRITETLAPGSYLIIARDLGNNDSGAFRLTVDTGLRANTIPISVGQTYDGFMQPGQEVLYGLTISSPQNVVIEFRRTGSAEFDPFLRLFNQAGGEIDSDDDGAGDLNSRIERFLEAGTYLIEVSDIWGSDGGSYRISVGR
jgi:hypothetical protein